MIEDLTNNINLGFYTFNCSGVLATGAVAAGKNCFIDTVSATDKFVIGDIVYLA